DEVRLEVGAGGRGLQLLEAVRQRERLGIEDRELLLDRDREVRRRLVLLASAPELLRPAENLVRHGERLVERLEQAFCDSGPTPALDHGSAGGFSELGARGGIELEQSLELLCEVARIGGREADQVLVRR